MLIITNISWRDTKTGNPINDPKKKQNSTFNLLIFRQIVFVYSPFNLPKAPQSSTFTNLNILENFTFYWKFTRDYYLVRSGRLCFLSAFIG